VVLLAILEAVNKQKGIFTTDDLNLVTVFLRQPIVFF